MKAFSSDLLNSFNKRVTTIAQCAKIIRADGTTYRFTNYDLNLVIDGETYISSYAFNPTAYSSALGLQIENMEIEGAIDDLNIDDFDIIKNKFYGAEVWFFNIDYKNITNGKDKILYGTVGEIEITDKVFKMEVRGMSKRYANLYAEYYGKICRARLGDSRCKVDLQTLYKTTGTVYDDTAIEGSILTKHVRLSFYSGTYNADMKIYEIRLLDRIGNNLTQIGLESIKINNTVGTENYKCGSDPALPITNLVDDNNATYLCIYENGSRYTNEVEISFNSFYAFSSIEIVDAGSGSKVDNLTLKTSDNYLTWTTYFSNISVSSYRVGNTVRFNFGNLLSTSQSSKRFRFYSNEVANFEQNYFQYGYIKWLTGLNSGVQAEIIQSLPDGLIEIALPTPYNIYNGDTFEIFPGCNHLLIGRDGTPYTGDCFSKFNNCINFRGEPYLPNEDVLLSGFIAIMNSRDTEEGSTEAVLEPQ